jgi:hypothetical protein
LRLSLPGLLVLLVTLLAGTDMAWAIAGHFRLDVAAYFRLCVLALALLAAARVYATARPDPRLAAMLFGTGFLCAFSLGASVLNYLLLTRAGTRIDDTLAAMDRALGFDWPRAMAWMAVHPRLNALAYGAYSSMLPQVAILTIALATVDPARVYRFIAAIAIGALVCIAVWSFAPSFGAFSVYANPAPQAFLALDGAYAREIVRLLKDGPGLISPADAKGLIGFPSYHAVLALLVMAHARALKYLRWPAVLLNIAVLLATPVQGGHHVMDVLGAIPVTALALWMTAARKVSRISLKTSGLVNKTPSATLKPLFPGAFCIDAAQDEKSGDVAIKPKLSGVP